MTGSVLSVLSVPRIEYRKVLDCPYCRTRGVDQFGTGTLTCPKCRARFIIETPKPKADQCKG